MSAGNRSTAQRETALMSAGNRFTAQRETALLPAGNRFDVSGEPLYNLRLLAVAYS